MQKLEEYINSNFATKTAFAKQNKVNPQQVSLWIRLGYIVINEQIYKPMRLLKSQS